MAFAKRDTFAEREIRVGLKSDSRIEVLSGLALGDSVAADAEKLFKKREEERDE